MYFLFASSNSITEMINYFFVIVVIGYLQYIMKTYNRLQGSTKYMARCDGPGQHRTERLLGQWEVLKLALSGKPISNAFPLT